MTIQNQDKEHQDNEEYSKNFARIPNILFLSFQHLSKEEKFLYCTLKSLYWDPKPRFVSLRNLSEMTGYSRSALGNMLPRLHKCGLVHTEIRRERNSKGIEHGNPKYNITILDIWELNRTYHDCPPDGRDALDPSLILVHENGQEPVHEKGQPCPPNKPRVSTKAAKPVHQTDKITPENELVEPVQAPSKDILKIKEEREKTDRPHNRPSTSVSLPLQQPMIPQEATTIMDYWDEIEGEPVPRTDKHIKAAITLAACHPTKEELQKRKAHGLADNPEWYNKHGLDLHTLANNWSKWKPHAPRSPATKTAASALPGYQSLKNMIPADFQVKKTNKTPSEVK